jgi:hypothetical protein
LTNEVLENFFIKKFAGIKKFWKLYKKRVPERENSSTKKN